jgi:hypothetical protein
VEAAKPESQKDYVLLIARMEQVSYCEAAAVRPPARTVSSLTPRCSLLRAAAPAY